MQTANRQRPPPGTLFLDHVSHFVPELDATARALQALGFTVTPVSAQQTQDGPAGTSNVCVMLKEGYLEFLAPTADTANAARLRTTMQRYPGVHLACFGTPAAEDEHARLGWHGFEPQPLVQLERPVEVDGGPASARFKVARAAPDRMPEGRIQFVEHLTPEALWQSRYLGHANRVTRLACVFAVADDVAQVAARWARFAALLPQRAGRFAHLETARGHVLIGTRDDWVALLGHAAPAPGLCGYALECSEPGALVSRCERLGMRLRRLRDNLYAATLPDALGGAWIFGTRGALAFPTRAR
ncbi:MAG TPA: VOC family protein [Burkholderiales bacterium]|nr:VOC family protein [Burkholderiales bacterium]